MRPAGQKLPLIYLALAAALVAAFALYFAYAPPAKAPAAIAPSTPMQSTLATTTLTIGATKVVAEVADTDASRELGLGGRTSLADGRGMWFVFDTDGLWAFWMKDTLIPLDMIWVADDGTIITIAHDVQPDSFPQGFYPAAPARYVLEVPAGFTAKHSIDEGDKVVLP